MEAITATYVQDDADWTITVSGRGKTLTAHAPGIIAARDMADQLAEQLAPDAEKRTVVHLLNGSALHFTAAYLEARMGRANGTAAQADDQASGATEQSASPGQAPAADERDEASVPQQPAKATERKPPAAQASQRASAGRPGARTHEEEAQAKPDSGEPEGAAPVSAAVNHA